MILKHEQSDLQLKHAFGVAGHTRKSTPRVYVKLEKGELSGEGEAVLPPYLGVTVEEVQGFLSSTDVSNFEISWMGLADFHSSLLHRELVLPAVAALDIAFVNLIAAKTQIPVYQMLGSDPSQMPATAFTIALGPATEQLDKMKAAESFKIWKIKLGDVDDLNHVKQLRKNTDRPFYVDANQAWQDKYKALDLIFALEELRVTLVEQPLHKNAIADLAWLTERSPIPIIADESLQTEADLPRLEGAVHGINIKLMKCGGLFPALSLLKKARRMNFKVMIGCMTESPIGIMAAAALAPQCDFADLDGCFLLQEGDYTLPKLVEGKIEL